MNPFSYLFDRVAFSDDPHWQTERRLTNEFDASQIDDSEHVKATLLLETARTKLADRTDAFHRLEDKRNKLLVHASGLLALIFGAAKFLDLHSPWVTLSAISLASACAILIFSNRTQPTAATPSIRSLREGIYPQPHPHDWLAASLHIVSEGLAIHERHLAKQVNLAMWLILLGLVLLLPVLIWMSWA